MTILDSGARPPITFEIRSANYLRQRASVYEILIRRLPCRASSWLLNFWNQRFIPMREEKNSGAHGSVRSNFSSRFITNYKDLYMFRENIGACTIFGFFFGVFLSFISEASFYRINRPESFRCTTSNQFVVCRIVFPSFRRFLGKVVTKFCELKFIVMRKRAMLRDLERDNKRISLLTVSIFSSPSRYIIKHH